MYWMTCRALIICWATALLAPVCLGETGIPPEVLQLARMKQNMAKLLARVPDYTCMETVQRFRRGPGSARFRPLDTFHLEVAFVGGKEVYSEPGAHRFDERRVSELVGRGLTSDGDFAIQARTVFLNNTAQISFGAKEMLEAHGALRYNYRISLFGSGWTVKIGSAAGKVAEHGSFWADAETLDLLRIERFADEIPPDLAVSAIHTELEYGTARLNGESVSIPRSSDTVLTELSGAQNRNTTAFSQCHAARGETTISFDGEQAAESRPGEKRR